jgi:cellulose synthase/poly-beta-1,6-N-acetylglucosamine synthase-like glycosyltransferase
MVGMQGIWISGILILFLSLVFPFLHYIRCLYYSRLEILSDKFSYITDITVILPIKDEGIVIRNKLKELLSMDYPLDKIRILIVDSGSKDNGSEIANKFLSSYQGKIEYEIVTINQPGKSVAINHALNLITTDFFIMMDTEAILSKSTLKEIMNWFSIDEVGAVCGQFSPELNDLDLNYRNKFNIIRTGESAIFSTPIFEGSICAFRLKSLNGYKINPNINSDDTQLALLSIRNGFKSIMDKNISFSEPPTGRKNRRKRQLRRSQGLIRTLALNWDLLYRSNIKMIFLHSLYFHIMMPWLILFAFINIIGSSLFSIINYGIIQIDEYAISLIVILFFCSSKFFRNFIFGISILIEAQILLFLGVKLHIWETNKDLRIKSNDFRN